MSIIDSLLKTNQIDLTYHQQSTGDLLSQLVKNHKKQITKIKEPNNYGLSYYETIGFYVENFIYRNRDVFDYYQININYPRRMLKQTIKQRIQTANIYFDKQYYKKPSKETMTFIGSQITDESEYTANTGGMVLMIPYLTNDHFLETAESVILGGVYGLTRDRKAIR